MKRALLISVLMVATVAAQKVVERTETKVIDVTKKYRIEVVDLKRCDRIEVKGPSGTGASGTGIGGSTVTNWVSTNFGVNGTPSEVTVSCLTEVRP